MERASLGSAARRGWQLPGRCPVLSFPGATALAKIAGHRPSGRPASWRRVGLIVPGVHLNSPRVNTQAAQQRPCSPRFALLPPAHRDMPVYVRMISVYPASGTLPEECFDLVFTVRPEFARDALDAHDRLLKALKLPVDFEVPALDHPLPYSFSPETIRLLAVWSSP